MEDKLVQEDGDPEVEKGAVEESEGKAGMIEGTQEGQEEGARRGV